MTSVGGGTYQHLPRNIFIITTDMICTVDAAHIAVKYIPLGRHAGV
jgi:hypothetical protein